MIGSILLWPLIAVGILILIAIGVFLFIFWIMMLIDCIKRDFRNDNEKIVWAIVIALVTWIGAIIYYFVVKRANPKGIAKR